MEFKKKDENLIILESNKGNDKLKSFINSVKENPNEIDYFHILDSISNQKIDKDIIKLIFQESII